MFNLINLPTTGEDSQTVKKTEQQNKQYKFAATAKNHQMRCKCIFISSLEERNFDPQAITLSLSKTPVHLSLLDVDEYCWQQTNTNMDTAYIHWRWEPFDSCDRVTESNLTRDHLGIFFKFTV